MKLATSLFNTTILAYCIFAFTSSYAKAGTIINGIYMPNITKLEPGIYDNNRCYISNMGRENEIVSCVFAKN